jgi:hypothetical protein
MSTYFMFIRRIVVKHLINVAHILIMIASNGRVRPIISVLVVHLEVRLTNQLDLANITVSLVFSLSHGGLSSTHDLASLQDDALRIVRRLANY